MTGETGLPSSVRPSRLVLCKENDHTGLAGFGFHLTALEVGVALMVIAFGSGVGDLTLARGTRWLRLIGRCSSTSESGRHPGSSWRMVGCRPLS